MLRDNITISKTKIISRCELVLYTSVFLSLLYCRFGFSFSVGVVLSFHANLLFYNFLRNIAAIREKIMNI